MKSFLFELFTFALLGSVAATATVQAAELHVMSSGGFTAAYKLLGPKFSSATGNTLDTQLGPSMGKSPEAIPNGVRGAMEQGSQLSPANTPDVEFGGNDPSRPPYVPSC